MVICFTQDMAGLCCGEYALSFSIVLQTNVRANVHARLVNYVYHLALLTSCLSVILLENSSAWQTLKCAGLHLIEMFRKRAHNGNCCIVGELS